MTTFFLVRHAEHELIGKVLTGRRVDISLSKQGRAQAERLAARLAQENAQALHVSPMTRTKETAAPIAARLGVAARIVPALDEVDCGDWSGRPFDELNKEPAWQIWNTSRTTACAPGGERMLDVQHRVISHLESVRRECTDGTVIIVSHSDVLRAAILYYLGLALDEFAKIELAPASLSILAVTNRGGQLRLLNETCAP